MDYEEATILAAVLVILWRARPEFDRRAAFFDTRFSIGWTVSVAAAIGASIWLGEFAYKHVNYSNELWWQFELHGEASRFLRGTVGAVVLLLLFAFARLIGHAPHETERADRRGPGRGVQGDCVAGRDLSESRLPARQSRALRRLAAGVHHAACKGARGWRSAIRSDLPSTAAP